jgi:hypothetical protein
MNTFDSVHHLEAQMGRPTIGQEDAIEHLIIDLLTKGNILMNSLPIENEKVCPEACLLKKSSLDGFDG